MKFNFLVAIAIVTCILVAAMALVLVAAQGDQPAASPEKWGMLSGVITDKNNFSVPGVQVTLYEAKLDSSTCQYVNVRKYDSPDNPMISNYKAETGALGSYAFYRLSPGLYNVTGEKDGYHWQAIAKVTPGNNTLNVRNPSYSSSDGVPGIVVWSTISGMVVDKHRNGIPGATVKLWATRWANDTYENVKLAKIAENPQYTVSDPMVAAIGTYTYFDVPQGIYNITAEKDGHMWFAWVNASSRGTHTNNIALPDYMSPAENLSPVPSPSPVPATPWFTISGFVTDKNKNGIPGAKVTLYDAVANSTSGGLDSVIISVVENNPQLTTSDPSMAAIGTYTFYQVPKGFYNVTAEKTDAAGTVHMWYSWVNGTSGTQTINIAVPDYVLPA